MCSVDSVQLDASPQAKVSGVIGGLVFSVAVDFGYLCNWRRAFKISARGSLTMTVSSFQSRCEEAPFLPKNGMSMDY